MTTIYVPCAIINTVGINFYRHGAETKEAALENVKVAGITPDIVITDFFEMEFDDWVRFKADYYGDGLTT